MMIVQSVLFFVLGVVTTAFVVMLLTPVLWRRALSLSYKAAKMEVPLSLAEIEADRDFLRAQHAVEVCRLEEKLKAEQETNVQRKVWLDSVKEKIHTYTSKEKIHAYMLLETHCLKLKSELDDNKQLIDNLQQELSKREQGIRELSVVKSHCEIQKKLLRQQQRKINRLESNNERLKEQIKVAAKVDRQTLRTFRKEIKTIAATVAVGVAQGEGIASPIVKLTADTADDNSLAASIHHLLQNVDMKPAELVHRSENVDKQISAELETG